MKQYSFERKYDNNFTGRKTELRWLDDTLFGFNSFRPIIISGKGGVGKTALIKYWLSSRRISSTPLWLSANHNSETLLDNFVKELYEFRSGNEFIVVIDETDGWTEKQYIEASDRIYNYKAVRSLIFITRDLVKIERAKILDLSAMPENESKELIHKLLPIISNETSILEAISATQGYPLAISLLCEIMKNGNLNTISSILNEPLYNLKDNLLVPEKEIITNVSPFIVSQNQRIVLALKNNPTDLHSISPREFENILAELLCDMGWEVELTKQTRDGGSDILAYLNTEVGRLLCLVEAKHYRQDRKIGVDLVRTLYGTLCDAQANSAMLVTTSSFSSVAKEFQQRHKYQLSLRDYDDIVKWIMKYGNNKNHA